MTRAPLPTSSEAPAKRFGREIAAARRAGTDPAELTLRLTLMDASKIKRDREIALEDISFSPEGMRFMGVRVVEGGVKSSDLVEGYEPPPEPEPVAAKPKRKAAAKPKVAKVAKAPKKGDPMTAPDSLVEA